MISQLESAPQLKIVQGFYLINLAGLYREIITGKGSKPNVRMSRTNRDGETCTPCQWQGQRKAESKRAQIVGKRGATAPQTTAQQKGKKVGRNFWKRNPPHANRIRFLFAGGSPVWGGYPRPLNLRHIFDIALTFPTQKTTQKVYALANHTLIKNDLSTQLVIPP